MCIVVNSRISTVQARDISADACLSVSQVGDSLVKPWTSFNMKETDVLLHNLSQPWPIGENSVQIILSDPVTNGHLIHIFSF